MQRVLVGVLDAILRLVQPIMPFVAESIWQALAEAALRARPAGAEPAAESVVIAPWPAFPAAWQDAAMEARMARMQELVRVVREVRNRYQIDARTPLDVIVRCTDAVAADFRRWRRSSRRWPAWAGWSAARRRPSRGSRRRTCIRSSSRIVSLAGLIDVDAEIKRLEKQLAEKLKHLQAARGKLSNSNFVDKAPAEVVQQQRDLVEDLQKQVQAIEENLRDLREG